MQSCASPWALLGAGPGWGRWLGAGGRLHTVWVAQPCQVETSLPCMCNPPLPGAAHPPCPCSFAYDGRRRFRWNVSNHAYGEFWAAGDVIGCCIDLDAGTMRFHRNGRDLVRWVGLAQLSSELGGGGHPTALLPAQAWRSGCCQPALGCSLTPSRGAW